MSKKWVVVADQSRARIFTVEDPRGPLLLVAGPPLLGLLRDNLKSLSGAEIFEIDKNPRQYEAPEIRSHLPDRL